MKPELTLERFLDVFVPGVLLSVGTWYLHRPFLLLFFPTVASDATILNDASGALGGKAFVFSIVAITMGLLCNHLSDVALVGLIKDTCQSPKARRRDRSLFRLLLLPFGFTTAPDPRVFFVNRYLTSPRRELFLRMLDRWCVTDAKRLEMPDEAVIAHQHVLSHLQVLSSETRSMTADLFRPVSIAASLFTASALLVPIALISFITRLFAIGRVSVHPVSVLLLMTLAVYCFAVLAFYSLRRRFRHFCAQILTLGLHAYLQEDIPERERS
ncbi:MAG: hypothetical protein NT011_06965 [Kiritimatiellaeota bacterium]|nr:hypothetical protein [Kiritimatiellota bacterium]